LGLLPKAGRLRLPESCGVSYVGQLVWSGKLTSIGLLLLLLSTEPKLLLLRLLLLLVLLSPGPAEHPG
jgi:hypothetical protein